MEDSRSRGFTNGDEFEFDSSSSQGESEANTSVLRESADSRGEIDALLNEDDGDLLVQESDRVLQWLQALDMQVLGACRADERLKPLLKVNVSSGIADDGFLAHLSQHFGPSEIGLLARCFCVPLVSVRVGKIDKQGTLLCPTSIRGNLNLTILPTTDLRISFVGDNGNVERLATLSSKSQCAAVTVQEIAADTSGSSFFVRISASRVFYFWCSEKSKLLGNELLSKMKDILRRKPSIAEITGISESRLGCFTTRLCAFLVESKASKNRPLPSETLSYSTNSAFEVSATSISSELASADSLLSGHTSKPAVEANSQGSLNPRSLSPTKSVSSEKSRCYGDRHLFPGDNPTIASPVVTQLFSSTNLGGMKLPEATGGPLCCPSIPSNPLESLGKSAAPQIRSSVYQVPALSSALLSPYYCWCPPGASTLQHSAAIANFPPSMEMAAAPTPSSLVTLESTTMLMPAKPLSLADIPIELPALLPDSLVRMPLASSQQITFTPIMCDPVVHIPVINVCSSGQGYLVSAGSAITTAIPPLHPNLVNPVLPAIDPLVEKGARETLRLLISNSAATSPQLMDVLPAVLTKADEKPSVFATGSRGLYSGSLDINAVASSVASLYSGTLDIHAVASSVASLGLISNSEVSMRNRVVAESCRDGDVGAQTEGLTNLKGNHSEGDSTVLANPGKGRTD